MFDCDRLSAYCGPKNLLILLLVVACTPNADAVSLPDGPEVGQIAPPLELSTWLQAPPEAALGWPIGKVVVLEYWAIWCGPCVAYIPHLNKLADEFKGKPVQFIAVTDDKESVIKNFLKKTPINAWIGLGANAGLGEKTPYRVWSLPHTVIIDAQGRVAAITNPFTLTSAMIQSCLDGSLGMPAREQIYATNKIAPTMEYWTSDGGQIPGMVPGQYKMGIKPLFQVMIRPALTNATTSSRPVESWMQNRALTIQNDPLNQAIQIAFSVKPTRIVAEADLPKEKYDFYINLPEIKEQPPTKEKFEALFAQAVADAFGLTVKREKRDIDALVVKTNAHGLGILLHSTNSTGENRAFPGEASASDKPLSGLAEELEMIIAKPVLDETGLTNHYDFDIKWAQKDYAHPNIAGITEAVTRMGLDLVPEKKTIEVVVVRQEH